MELQTGDIVFFSGTDLLSKSIRYFTKSKVSHVAIVMTPVVEGNPDGVVLAEALSEGFVITKSSKKWINDSCAVGRVYDKLTATQRDKLRSEISKIVGDKYDFIALLEILYFIIFGVELKKVSDNRVICSEAVEQVYRQLGTILVNKEIEYVTPQDLYSSKKVKVYKDFTQATKDL